MLRSLLIRLGLRFEDAQDECRFVRRFTLDDLGRTQGAMVLGAFVYCAFAAWDWILDPTSWTTTLAIRLTVTATTLLPLTAALLFDARAQARAELQPAASVSAAEAALRVRYGAPVSGNKPSGKADELPAPDSRQIILRCEVGAITVWIKAGEYADTQPVGDSIAYAAGEGPYRLLACQDAGEAANASCARQSTEPSSHRGRIEVLQMERISRGASLDPLTFPQPTI